MGSSAPGHLVEAGRRKFVRTARTSSPSYPRQPNASSPIWLNVRSNGVQGPTIRWLRWSPKSTGCGLPTRAMRKARLNFTFVTSQVAGPANRPGSRGGKKQRKRGPEDWPRFLYSCRTEPTKLRVVRPFSIWPLLLPASPQNQADESKSEQSHGGRLGGQENRARGVVDEHSL